ncbi:MAG: putative endonuclease [Nocardioides sp.]|nr:putative endonuclease [Nocardioides sp.]
MSQSEVQLHPVLAAMSAVGAVLSDVAEVDPMYMDAEEKAAALLGLSTIVDRVEELRMRVLASAADVAAQQGARDAAAWLAHHGRRDPDECRRQLRLAGALAEREATAAALREGGVNLAQAEVVVRALDALPAEIGAGVRTAAETRLLQEAARFGPRALRVLGRRIVDVVAPEVSEGLEGRLLEQEEARAARRTSLTTRRNGDGTTDIHIRVADLVCDRFLTYLDAFTAPRRGGTGSADDRRPHDRRLGEAFVAFLEAIDPARLPLHGGDATTLLVTVDLDVLRSGLGTGLVGDAPVSADQVRRLACTAGIVPVVLGGAGQVLDLGRQRRLFSPSQRKALALRQPTCGAGGCDIPAAWCEAHHAGAPWSRGGCTDLTEGVLLCSFHHHRAHDHHYRTDRLADGGLRFHRRT